MAVAAWFIHSGIYASGGLVYTQWNICQWRIGLYLVKYMPVAIGLYSVEYMPVAPWFLQSGIYPSGGLVYT
jgi:hypothetical protein